MGGCCVRRASFCCACCCWRSCLGVAGGCGVAGASAAGAMAAGGCRRGGPVQSPAAPLRLPILLQRSTAASCRCVVRCVVVRCGVVRCVVVRCGVVGGGHVVMRLCGHFVMRLSAFAATAAASVVQMNSDEGMSTETCSNNRRWRRWTGGGVPEVDPHPEAPHLAARWPLQPRKGLDASWSTEYSGILWRMALGFSLASIDQYQQKLPAAVPCMQDGGPPWSLAVAGCGVYAEPGRTSR